MGLNTWKTWTVVFGPLPIWKPGPWKRSVVTRITLLSSNRIVTWFIPEFCSFTSSFSCWSLVLKLGNICWVAVENPRFEWYSKCYFIVTQWSLIRLQIGDLGAKDHRKLHLLPIYHVVIQWELKNLIAANIVGTIKWNCSQVPNRPKTLTFWSSPGQHPEEVTQFCALAVPNRDWGLCSVCNPDCGHVAWNCW